MSRVRLVIDASAALHMAASARPVPGLDRFDLVAPPIYPSERTSALSAALFRGDLPPAAGDELFDRLERLPVSVIDGDENHRRDALRLARSLGWAKTYDAEYVVLAQRLGCDLLTIDERLARGVDHLIRIRRPAAITDDP